MRNLMRLRSRKYSAAEIEDLVSKGLATIRGHSDPIKIYLFGSALGENFDDFSDLDFLLVFQTKEQAVRSRQLLYRQSHAFSHPVDFICVDNETFEQKAEIGGVYLIAKQDGRLLYSK